MSVKRNIVILGGGTAGWMAANLMVAGWGERGFKVTLVESPDIGRIGVGEGSTPQLKEFFDRIGLSESDWMPRCNATYKLGIGFENWSGRDGCDRYFHPFPARTDTFSARSFVQNCFERRQGRDVPVNPDDFFLNSHLCAQKLGPAAQYSFPFPVQYGYHFDSHLLGQVLAEHARGRGVEHRLAKVSEVRTGESGDISALVTEEGEEIPGDLFVDSTGFAGVLMQKTLGVGFRSFENNLFNDSAVVLPTPPLDDPAPQTVSTAMKNGWRWQIPLANRVGNGYVYSSKYCSAEEAEAELREALQLDDEVEARHLRMRVGQLEQHWHRNCVAVGLAQGFIEPLEATALHLVQVTIESFMEAYERGGFGPDHQAGFNDRISRRFEGIRDYIVSHYRVSARDDTPYWRDNASNENLSASLKGVLSTWLGRGDLSLELKEQGIEQYYTTLSWHALLAGYGLFPDAVPSAGMGDGGLTETTEFIRRCAMNFQPHSECLESLRDHASS